MQLESNSFPRVRKSPCGEASWKYHPSIETGIYISAYRVHVGSHIVPCAESMLADVYWATSDQTWRECVHPQWSWNKLIELGAQMRLSQDGIVLFGTRINVFKMLKNLHGYVGLAVQSWDCRISRRMSSGSPPIFRLGPLILCRKIIRLSIHGLDTRLDATLIHVYFFATRVSRWRRDLHCILDREWITACEDQCSVDRWQIWLIAIWHYQDCESLRGFPQAHQLALRLIFHGLIHGLRK